MSVKCVGGFNGGIQKWNGECYFSLVGLDRCSEKAYSPFDQSKGLRAYLKARGWGCVNMVAWLGRCFYNLHYGGDCWVCDDVWRFRDGPPNALRGQGAKQAP